MCLNFLGGTRTLAYLSKNGIDKAKQTQALRLRFRYATNHWSASALQQSWLQTGLFPSAFASLEPGEISQWKYSQENTARRSGSAAVRDKWRRCEERRGSGPVKQRDDNSGRRRARCMAPLGSQPQLQPFLWTFKSGLSSTLEEH